MAVQTKWTAASYKEERFLQNNAKWLTDPLLSCTRSRFMKNKKPFTKEALEFLIPESDDSEDTGAQYTTTIDECDISDDNEFD
ncbi:hypothetical protein EVAR_102282_1 [Eumeta japonica]|uniref:Uncharacterized protein n=1 Tax=Eumeta variegata TaxID=151549 RepID=A0A4C1WBM2_EUMVA|nr:hypothetical protein EVAR_40103_1 [Eumeta japonica]GBP50313.1 hypothetical protein EVAR_102282_1 [Eumeta japonica]